MYEWSKDCCPVCGQTTPSTAAPCQIINYTTYKQRQDILRSKLFRDCICSKKFMKCQKWTKRQRHQQFFIDAPYANNFVSTSSKVIQYPSWILMLTFMLLLVCCQGNNVQPAPTMVNSELHDVMVPVGKAFYYKIPVSAFQCEVEHLMVTEASNRFLSHWLAYNSLEWELYGVPSCGDVGTYTILVVALARGELKRGEICGSKTFVITVPPEGDARIPIPLMSAALQSAVMGEDGSVQFDNPNMGYRMPCFPGMHTTFASVLINTDFNQLNGHERINTLQRVAVHLGISPAKISGFSDQVSHPLISGLESPSLIATGAGDGRFVKGIRTVFTWTLGCGALKVDKTAISHLTASSQDGTFSESVGHSIFGWHIMSGVQKSLPKIRVRRAALVGTPTPTTTVAMPTAVSITSTTVVSNGSVSLSRVVPSVNSTISLTPHIVSSTLVAPTLSPNLTASSMEFMVTLNLSASEVQTLDATVFSPSTMLNSTTDAVTVIGTSSTVPSFSPSLLLPTQNVTVVLSPSPTAIFQTATFSPTPRINSSVAEVKTTSLVVESSLTVGPTISDSAVHSTTLETQNSSSATEGQYFSPMLSRILNQTATVVDSLSQTIEPSTVLSTAINQTSLMMTTVSTSSSIISAAVSVSAVNNTTASVSILPSSNVTSASEMISSLITQPNRTESLTPSTNQTGSSPTINATSSVSASKTSPVVMTTVPSTTNGTQVIPTSSSVVQQLNKTSDLALSISLASFTPALNLTSSINVTRSRPVMTTALDTSTSQNITVMIVPTPSSQNIIDVIVPTPSSQNITDVIVPTPSSQNITDVIVPTPSSVMHQPSTTDGVVPSGNETTMSPVFSLTPQVTMTTATFVIAPTTQIVTSSHVSSMIPLTATPTVLGTSTRFFITANATKSQVLSATLSNSTHVSVKVSAMTLSLNMSAGDRGSLSVSPVLNKTTLAVVTESPVSPVLSLSTEMESSKAISAVPTADVLLSPTTFSVAVIESSKMTQMKSPSDIPTLSTIPMIGSSLLPSESVLFSSTEITELASSPSATSSGSVTTSGLNLTTLLSPTSSISHNLSRIVELATASRSLISNSSLTIPLVIVSTPVLTSSVSVTLVTSSIVSKPIISSTLSDRLKSTKAITAQPSVTIPSSVDAVESSLTVMAVNSSSPVLFANESVTFMSIPTPVSTTQLVSHSVVKTSTTGRITRASSSTVALSSPTVTSDITPPEPSPVPTPLPSTTQIAVITSKMPTMDASSPPLTSTLRLNVSKTSITTGSALLSSIFPTVINVSVIFTPTTTVIPTSIGPTLEPSTGPTMPPNNGPARLNDIGRLEAKVGKAFRYAVPHDTFHDHEDGDTRNLSLSCTLLLKGAIPSDYWVQFDSERQELYGLPLAMDYERYSGKDEYERYILTARDSRGLTARDVFQIVMIFVTDTVTQQLSIRTSNNYTVFSSNVTQRLDLVERIRTYYSDSDTSAIRFVSVRQGSLVVTWTNDTLPSDRCEEEAVQRISSKVISAEGEVNPAFRNALKPEFPIQSAREERFGVCNVTQTYPTIPSRGQSSASETDMWLKHVLPGVLVALLILLLALILVIYLRRRRPKPSNPEKITYKKRKPIVLGEEIELKALPAKPLILPDDDISCPPSYLSETSLDKAPHYETDDEDEEDFGKRSPSIRYELPPPFYHTFDSPRNTPPPSYRLPPSYRF